jgi:hypothetical protein
MGGLVTFRTGWGLWRSPVAHLVRIEGARGSNPLSSTTVYRSLYRLVFTRARRSART